MSVKVIIYTNNFISAGSTRMKMGNMASDFIHVYLYRSISL